MKQLVQDRKDKCDKGHLIIDLDQKAVKCYTKASRITRTGVVQAQKALPLKFHCQKSPSELFKFLGVDCVC